MPSVKFLLSVAVAVFSLSTSAVAEGISGSAVTLVERDAGSIFSHNSLDKRAPRDNRGAKCHLNSMCHTSVHYARPSCGLNYRCDFKCQGGTVREHNRCVYRPKNYCKRSSQCKSTVLNSRSLCYHNQCTFQCRSGWHREGMRCVRNQPRCSSVNCAPVQDGYSSCYRGKCSYHCATYLGYSLFTNRNKTAYRCINLADDAQNCGSVGNVCKTGYNGKGVPVCQTGDCSLDCRGFGSVKTSGGQTYCASS